MKLLKSALQLYESFTDLTNKWDDREREEYEFSRLPAISRAYRNNITGDACVGDQVAFVKQIWGGSHRKPKLIGFEIVEGTIINESYGADKQQHTFTLKVKGGTLKIKDRNLYKLGLWAKARDPIERQAALDEQHKRGDVASKNRDLRRESYVY